MSAPGAYLGGVERDRRAGASRRHRPPHHAGLEDGLVHAPQGSQLGRGQALGVPLSLGNAALLLAGDVLEPENRSRGGFVWRFV